MPEDLHLTATLTDVLVYARSSPSLDDLLDFYVTRARALVGADAVEVRPGRPGPGESDTRDGAGGTHASSHPVSCGPTLWGELRLTYRDGSRVLGDLPRGRLLAEVLGAALVSAGVDADTSGAAPAPAPPAALAAAPARVPTGVLPADDAVDLVLACAETLDLMADASTRARLVVVASRLAAAVGATSWSVGLAHEGVLHEVARAGVPGATEGGFGASVAPSGSAVLSGFPARLRASEGGGFYADRGAGDAAERRALVEAGDAAVIGAGGYDLDGRSWVVTVVAGPGAHLEQVTPVLVALVLAALSFPREAVVPRPQEPWIRDTISRSRLGPPAADVRGIGEAG